MSEPASRLMTDGIYLVREAAALLGISQAKVRAWATRAGNPLWPPVHDDILGQASLTFLELLDLAATVLVVEHERTSIGRVRSIRKEMGSPPYTLIDRRTELPGGIGMSLRRFLDNLDYAGDDFLPSVWWPLERDVPVLLDPLRSFGSAVVADKHVPVSALANAVAVEGNFEVAGRMFRVPVKSVMAAVTFELRKQIGTGFLNLPVRL